MTDAAPTGFDSQRVLKVWIYNSFISGKFGAPTGFDPQRVLKVASWAGLASRCIAGYTTGPRACQHNPFDANDAMRASHYYLEFPGIPRERARDTRNFLVSFLSTCERYGNGYGG